jgi:hypothetical protein
MALIKHRRQVSCLEYSRNVLQITSTSPIRQIVLVDAILPVLTKTSQLPESSVRICVVSY